MPDGVFETFLVVDGEPVEPTGHLERLQNATGMDASELLHESTSELSGHQQLRIDLTASGSVVVISEAIAIPDLFKGEFKHLQLATRQLNGQRRETGHGPHKVADREELEALEAEVDPAIPLLIDSSGNALETSRHNVFIVEEESLVTPPLDGRILPGVTRQAVLEEAQQLGLNTQVEPVPLRRAQAASGMLLTNAIVGLGWVEQCDDTLWPEIPSTAWALHQALADRWRSSLTPAVP